MSIQIESKCGRKAELLINKLIFFSFLFTRLRGKSWVMFLTYFHNRIRVYAHSRISNGSSFVGCVWRPAAVSLDPLSKKYHNCVTSQLANDVYLVSLFPRKIPGDRITGKGTLQKSYNVR